MESFFFFGIGSPVHEIENSFSGHQGPQLHLVNSAHAGRMQEFLPESANGIDDPFLDIREEVIIRRQHV